jgi:thymidine kinase
MTDIALYPGDRGSGKTKMLIEQVRQSATVGQDVIVLVHSIQRRSDLYREINEWEDVLRRPEVFAEVNFYTSRGLQPHGIFIDDANLFQENPIYVASRFHPGVPLTVTYTPSPQDQYLTSLSRSRTLPV